jgi:hypothetical protein
MHVSSFRESSLYYGVTALLWEHEQWGSGCNRLRVNCYSSTCHLTQNIQSTGSTLEFNDRPRHCRAWEHTRDLCKAVALDWQMVRGQNIFQDHAPWATKRRIKKLKLHGLSLWANYTDRATAACQRSQFQLLRLEVAARSAWLIPTTVF